MLATAVFLVATVGLRIYLTYITSTGYTYGALATPIAFLLFAFFLGFAIMIGAELNAADRRGVAGAGHPREAVPVVAGGEGGRVARVAQRRADAGDRTDAAGRAGQGRRRYFLSFS